MGTFDGVDGRNDPYFAEFAQARDLLLGPDWRDGLDALEALAHRGSLNSMLLVAGCMMKGWGYEQALPLAVAWYQAAVESGSTRGLHGLGLAHSRMEQYGEAIEALQAAVARSYPPAYDALAYMYAYGHGVPVDRKRALRLWREGYSLGHLMSKRGVILALARGYAGFRGRIEGWLNILPLAVEIMRARREPPLMGSGDFLRTTAPGALRPGQLVGCEGLLRSPAIGRHDGP